MSSLFKGYKDHHHYNRIGAEFRSIITPCVLSASFESYRSLDLIFVCLVRKLLHNFAKQHSYSLILQTQSCFSFFFFFLCFFALELSSNLRLCFSDLGVDCSTPVCDLPTSLSSESCFFSIEK